MSSERSHLWSKFHWQSEGFSNLLKKKFGQERTEKEFRQILRTIKRKITEKLNVLLSWRKNKSKSGGKGNLRKRTKLPNTEPNHNCANCTNRDGNRDGQMTQNCILSSNIDSALDTGRVADNCRADMDHVDMGQQVALEIDTDFEIGHLNWNRIRPLSHESTNLTCYLIQAYYFLRHVIFDLGHRIGVIAVIIHK